MSAPVLLSEQLSLTLRQLAKRHERQHSIREMNYQLNELQARQAFHLDPTHDNLTAWCDAKEALTEYLEGVRA